MTLFTTMAVASTTPSVDPARTAARKTLNLANQPANGGTPPSEIRNAARAMASTGARRANPDRSRIRSVGYCLDTPMATANAPSCITA